MVRRCFPVAKIVGSSPIRVAYFDFWPSFVVDLFGSVSIVCSGTLLRLGTSLADVFVVHRGHEIDSERKRENNHA